ncbi:hypothetical protein AVEN_95396-1 [Araneus ventricosus]|uniref:Uncharacterized protein n=1 Tax=Araneus ventricosus TaxID=182803 RepID=A0A4Y2CGR3_ARAVE|nr:hypothetical protein AVEN_95396-1 [Araneus ventricosus]
MCAFRHNRREDSGICHNSKPRFRSLLRRTLPPVIPDSALTGPQHYPDNGLVSGTRGKVSRNQEEEAQVRHPIWVRNTCLEEGSLQTMMQKQLPRTVSMDRDVISIKPG